MRLVIAEKPSVAMAIARVIGAPERKDGYMIGKEFLVSWCVGHLVALCDAADYDERYARWRYDDLPIIPEEWKHKVLSGTRKQFNTLKSLMNRKDVKEVICATDAGREGELIFRLVYEQAGCRKPVRRLWISSMEEKAIREGFENLKDGSCYEDLYQSALCRARADWLVGINASRLFSVLYNKNLKVGRVQTPTLAMIVERDQKIRAFQKEKYFVVHLKDMELDAVSEHLKTREEAEKIAADCRQRMCEVIHDDVDQKTVNPPKLYDLTTLQRDANRLFGYTAQEVLDTAQSLYEKKLMTYPRTDSSYLTDDMAESAEELAEMLEELLPFADEETKEEKNFSRILNSEKVSDHHGLIPTGVMKRAKLDQLEEKEKNILILVSSRLLMAVSTPYRYESHKCDITCNYHTFHITARRVKQEGYRRIEKAMMKYLGLGRSWEEDPELNIYLGAHFGPCETTVAEEYTKPPREYTEDTLLSAMERAGNDEITEETEKKGLGTPATRAAIIEKLIRSGFVRREKRYLIPTDDGNALITVLPDEIKSPKMTAEWEMTLNHIAQGKDSPERFMQEIDQMLQELVSRYKGISGKESTPFPRKRKYK